MSNIRVSIIVPCYKVEAYLPRCLNSLVNQTLEDIEIICINDGSPDRCIDILRDYEQRYPGKIVVIDKQNEGVWRGRWDGIRIARGDYIGFLDSDDYAEPNFARYLYEAAVRSDADLAVCGFSRVDMDTGDKLTHEMCTRRPPFSIENDPGRLLELNGAPWNKIFRASTLKQMHDLEAPPKVLDDMLFQMLAFLEMQGTVVFTPRNLVNYMIRSDSIINTISLEKLQTGYDAFREVRRIYEADGASALRLQAFDAIAFEHLGVSMMFRLSCDPSIDLDEQVRRCTAFLDEQFPTWRDNPYLSWSYARRHGSAALKLLVAHRVYKAHLMKPFLALYRFAINKLKVDIKW